MYDVVIVGGGPAGSTLARKLTMYNFKVLLIEKHKLPRYKACGGGITPRCYDLLDLNFNDYIEDKSYQISFMFGNNNNVAIRSTKPLIYQVDRMKFDKYLVDKAVESGTILHTEETFINYKYTSNYIKVKTNKGLYETRLLVGADGINSNVAHMAELTIDKKGIAFEAEVYADESKMNEMRGRVIVDFSAIPYGYGWIFPKKDRLAIGIGTFKNKVKNIKDMLNKFLVKYDVDKFRADSYGHLLSFNNGSQKRYNTDNVILVGDATQLGDPFTGEGIYNAIKTANIASDVIKNYFNSETSLNEYTRLLKSDLIPDIKSAYNLSLFVYHNMNHIKSLVKTFPNVFSYFTNILIGQDNYINYKKKIPLYAFHIKNTASDIQLLQNKNKKIIFRVKI